MADPGPSRLGRYTFGIGLGNTPDDYPLFGIDADPRYSRFAEAIQIIHELLRDGRTDFNGTYYQAPGARLILRGPHPSGPPIVIAAGKPKALRLVARYADEWNWWISERDAMPRLRELVTDMERACEEVGRDPATLRRSLDVFSVMAPGARDGTDDEIDLQIAGTTEEIADAILAYGELGFAEVRVDLRAGDMPSTEAIAAMKDVVSRVHDGG